MKIEHFVVYATLIVLYLISLKKENRKYRECKTHSERREMMRKDLRERIAQRELKEAEKAAQNVQKQTNEKGEEQ